MCESQCCMRVQMHKASLHAVNFKVDLYAIMQLYEHNNQLLRWLVTLPL